MNNLNSPLLAVIYPELGERTHRWIAASVFLLVVFLERCAFYCFTSMFVFSLTSEQYQYFWSYEHAIDLFLAYNIVGFMVGLISAFIADFWISRIKVLPLAGIIYLFGFLGLISIHDDTMGSHVGADNMFCSRFKANDTANEQVSFFEETCATPISFFAICINFGAGLAKPFLPFLGADQIRALGIDDVRRYFMWYYMASNLGSFLAFLMPLALSNGNNTWMTILLIALTLLLLSCVILAVGLLVYNTDGSHAQFSYILEICLHGLPLHFQRRNNKTAPAPESSTRPRPSRSFSSLRRPPPVTTVPFVSYSLRGGVPPAGDGIVGIQVLGSSGSQWQQEPLQSSLSSQQMLLNHMAVGGSSSSLPEPPHLNSKVEVDRSSPVLERATSVSDPVKPLLPKWGFERLKREHGGPYLSLDVESARSLLYSACVFWVTLPFFILYAQKDSAFNMQARFLRLPHNLHVLRHSTGWLESFDTLPILVVCLCSATCLLPQLNRQQCIPSVRMRVILGMVLACASMFAAGLLEFYRAELAASPANDTVFVQTIGDGDYLATNLSIFWIIPQYVLLGLGEVLVVVTVLEYMYLSSTPWLKNLPSAFLWVTLGFSELVALTISVPLFSSDNMSCLQPIDPPDIFHSTLSPSNLSTKRPQILSPNWERHGVMMANSTREMYCPPEQTYYVHFALAIMLLLWVMFLIPCSKRRWFCEAILSNRHAQFIFDAVSEVEVRNQTVPPGVQTYPSGIRPAKDILPLDRNSFSQTIVEESEPSSSHGEPLIPKTISFRL